MCHPSCLWYHIRNSINNWMGYSRLFISIHLWMLHTWMASWRGGTPRTLAVPGLGLGQCSSPLTLVRQQPWSWHHAGTYGQPRTATCVSSTALMPPVACTTQHGWQPTPAAIFGYSSPARRPGPSWIVHFKWMSCMLWITSQSATK